MQTTPIAQLLINTTPTFTLGDPNNPYQLLKELYIRPRTAQLGNLLEHAIEELVTLNLKPGFNFQPTNLHLAYHIMEQIENECTDGCNAALYLDDAILCVTLAQHAGTATIAYHFANIYELLCNLYINNPK